MEALRVEPTFNKLMEPRWHKMFLLSLLLHLAIFSVILFVPESIPTRRIRGEIYEVNLVEMPSERLLKAGASSKGKTGKRLHLSKKATPARRISASKKKERPVVIAKRTLKTKRQEAKESKESSSRLIDQAVSRIERKVRAEKKDPIDQAVSKLEDRVKGAGEKKFAGGQADSGIGFRLYQIEVENWIKSNWSFPVALLSPRSKKDLEAVVLVRVKNNGTILKSWLKKRSSNVIFDQSVLKAIERSDPLPAFPEGYRKTHDEIEINFNLSDLEVY